MSPLLFFARVLHEGMKEVMMLLVLTNSTVFLLACDLGVVQQSQDFIERKNNMVHQRAVYCVFLW